MQGKLNKLIALENSDVEPISGAAGLVVEVVVNEKCSIQVNYAALSAGNLTLSASNDNVNYAIITDSTQAMDVAGGTHIWNVDGMFFKWLRVDLPAGGVDQTVLFAGNTPIVRA